MEIVSNGRTTRSSAVTVQEGIGDWLNEHTPGGTFQYDDPTQQDTISGTLTAEGTVVKAVFKISGTNSSFTPKAVDAEPVPKAEVSEVLEAPEVVAYSSKPRKY